MVFCLISYIYIMKMSCKRFFVTKFIYEIFHVRFINYIEVVKSLSKKMYETRFDD